MKTLLAFWLLTSASMLHAEELKKANWRFYTDLDVFAFSEPVSIDAFANRFDDKLEGGDTAFTNNHLELGAEFRNFRFALVQRLDYITEFTEDTALFHHSNKNRIPIDQSRQFDLFLDVERLSATGFKFGYQHNFSRHVEVAVNFTWYNKVTRLQSGSTGIVATDDVVDPQLRADIQSFFDNRGNSTDLDPLRALVSGVTGGYRIDYAYNAPKFSEDTYREPILFGDPNPVITGVNFDEPEGTGYSVDVDVSWQVRNDLLLTLELRDIANEFEWDNAPQTTATFDLNPFLLDAIDVAQDLLEGVPTFPNAPIEDNWIVNIRNETYEQKLPVRANLTASYRTGLKPDILGWKPVVSVTGGWHHTGTKDFQRVGLRVDGFRFEYDFAARSIGLGWQGRYLHARLLTDNFDFEKAHTLGLSVGLSVSL